MRTRDAWIDILGLCIAAMILLIACNAASHRRHLRAIVDNDAVGYTTAAHTLAETGKIASHIIYPSTLSQPATKSWLYMPGFYYLLAATYKVFGFGTMQSLSVSGAGFVIAAICTYLIGLRFFNRWTALLAAAFFMLYPANLYFAATAMTELPLVAAAAVALCVFVHLPRRWMPWVGPILLLLPFLFRETGAFLALPMALFILLPPKVEGTATKPQIFQAGLFMAISVILLGIVYVSPIASGRPSLIKADIFIKESGAERIYRDAFAADQIKATAGNWCRTLFHRFGDNVRLLAKRISEQQRSFYILMLLPLLIAIPVGFIWGAIQRDVPALGGAALLLLTLAFVCTFYSVRHDRPVRVAMFAFPLVALLEARLTIAFFSLIAGHIPPVFRLWPPAILILVVVAWVGATCFKGFTDMAFWDTADERANRFIEDLHHDDTTMLVAPHLLGIPYLNQHYPLNFSFVPANAETLQLLCSKYKVGTLILNPFDAIDLKPSDIEAQGLLLYSRYHIIDPEHLDGHYLIFKRPELEGDQFEWDTSKELEFNWVPRPNLRY